MNRLLNLPFAASDVSSCTSSMEISVVKIICILTPYKVTRKEYSKPKGNLQKKIISINHFYFFILTFTTSKNVFGFCDLNVPKKPADVKLANCNFI